MRVLVAAASRHEATAEIAETIGGVFSGQRTQADVMDIDDVPAGRASVRHRASRDGLGSGVGRPMTGSHRGGAA